MPPARALLPEAYSCEHGIYHYRSMAKTNYRGYLKGDMVPLKKYFYVLRPLLSVRWLERYGTAAPIEFSKLLHLVEDNPGLVDAIAELRVRKQAAPELGLAPPVAIINAFVEAELARLEGMTPAPTPRAGTMALLNPLFRDCLAAAW